MDIDERLIEIMKQTLTTLNDISSKLADIEENTQEIDQEQQNLRYSVNRLEHVMSNDNFVG